MVINSTIVCIWNFPQWNKIEQSNSSKKGEPIRKQNFPIKKISYHKNILLSFEYVKCSNILATTDKGDTAPISLGRKLQNTKYRACIRKL